LDQNQVILSLKFTQVEVTNDYKIQVEG